MMKSPMKNKPKLTVGEKIKAGLKGVGAGLSRALRASRTENVGYSTRVGIKEGKKAYKRSIEADKKD